MNFEVSVRPEEDVRKTNLLFCQHLFSSVNILTSHSHRVPTATYRYMEPELEVPKNTYRYPV